MNNQEQIQQLGQELIEGYFDSLEDYNEKKQQYIALKDIIEQNGEIVSDNIDFKNLPEPEFDDNKLNELFGV